MQDWNKLTEACMMTKKDFYIIKENSFFVLVSEFKMLSG